MGLGVAIEYALGRGVASISDRVRTLAEDLRSRLRKLPGVTVRDLGKEKCGIIAFTVEGRDPVYIKRVLGDRNVNVNVSKSRSTLLDMDDRRLGSLVRASVHYYNTEEEIERFCTELASAL